MRYSEDKIKEAILHPDLDVRDIAIRYFRTSTTPDPTVMPLAIRAIEQYGPMSAFAFANDLNELPQTEQTVAWVISELQREVEGKPEERHYYYLALSRLLCHADIRLVAPHAATILQAPHFDPKEQQAFRERLEMFGWDAETCWGALWRHGEANRDKNNIEEFDLGHTHRIVEALAQQPHPYQAQIVRLLTEPIPDDRHDAGTWMQPLMATLAGRMRLKEAIPPLIGNLGHRHGFLSDQSMFALARIGGDEVVAAVRDRFTGASRDFRTWASDLLRKIHLDSTVRLVLELLPGEADPEVRMNLCEALLDHFSSDGVEPTRQLLKSHELTPDLRQLRSRLVAFCKVAQVRFPEFEAWQAEAQIDAERERASLQNIERLAFEAGGDLRVVVQKLQAEIAKSKLERRRLQAEIADSKKALASRTGPPAIASPTKPGRIGRNDPCRCGSGKKFKHCCMR